MSTAQKHQKYQNQNLSFLTFSGECFQLFVILSSPFSETQVLEFGDDSSIYASNVCHGLSSVFSIFLFILCHSFLCVFSLLCCAAIVCTCVLEAQCVSLREAWKRAWRAFRIDTGADHSGNNCSDLHCGRGRGYQKAPLRE